MYEKTDQIAYSVAMYKKYYKVHKRYAKLYVQEATMESEEL